MQSMGFLHCLISGAKKEQRERIRREQKGFFNTHPYMASYIIGAMLRIYDDSKKYPDEIKRFLTVAQTSFASTGDLLFWRSIRPALLILATVLAFKVGLFGIIVFLIIYNVFHIYHRFEGIYSGFSNGMNVIFLLKTKRFVIVQRIFEITGAIATGLLIALAKYNAASLLVVPLTVFFLALVMRRIPAIIVILMLIVIIVFLSLV